MQFFCFAGNVSLGLSSNLKTILADFKAFKPTFILAVPRIFEAQVTKVGLERSFVTCVRAHGVIGCARVARMA